MAIEPVLARPAVIRTGDEVARDRPVRCCGEPPDHPARVAAGKPEIDRPACAGRVGNNVDQPRGLCVVEREGLAGRRRQNEAVERGLREVGREPLQRSFIELAVAKRGHQGDERASKHDRHLRERPGQDGYQVFELPVSSLS